jgi:hypothetical protein
MLPDSADDLPCFLLFDRVQSTDAPQHRLYFLPQPQPHGHGPMRPIFGTCAVARPHFASLGRCPRPFRIGDDALRMECF